MVERLNSEEESALRELIRNRTDAESVKKFIEKRLYDELSRPEGTDAYGVEKRTYLPGYHEQKQVYEALVEKGLLEGHRPGGGAFYWYGDLTSDGRCYFKSLWTDRLMRWSPVIVSGLLGIIGALAGAVVGAILTGWRP